MSKFSAKQLIEKVCYESLLTSKVMEFRSREHQVEGTISAQVHVDTNSEKATIHLVFDPGMSSCGQASNRIERAASSHYKYKVAHRPPTEMTLTKLGLDPSEFMHNNVKDLISGLSADIEYIMHAIDWR